MVLPENHTIDRLEQVLGFREIDLFRVNTSKSLVVPLAGLPSGAESTDWHELKTVVLLRPFRECPGLSVGSNAVLGFSD